MHIPTSTFTLTFALLLPTLPIIFAVPQQNTFLSPSPSSDSSHSNPLASPAANTQHHLRRRLHVRRAPPVGKAAPGKTPPARCAAASFRGPMRLRTPPLRCPRILPLLSRTTAPSVASEEGKRQQSNGSARVSIGLDRGNHCILCESALCEAGPRGEGSYLLRYCGTVDLVEWRRGQLGLGVGGDGDTQGSGSGMGRGGFVDESLVGGYYTGEMTV